MPPVDPIEGSYEKTAAVTNSSSKRQLYPLMSITYKNAN